MKALRLSLLTKFTITTCILVLGVMALFAYVNLRTLKSLWLQEAVKDVDNLSETIIRTTYYQMLEGDRDRVFQMIDEVGGQEGIEHIRLVNKDGMIIFSTDGTETHTMLDKDAAACNVCHSEATPISHTTSMDRSRIFTEPSGKEVLGLAKGIYNEFQCSNATCHAHSGESKLLGVLDVTVSLEGMRERINIYRQSLAVFTVLLLMLLFTCLWVLTRNLVVQPVHHLLRQTRKLSRGELEGQIEVHPGGELGELADAFDEMTVNLRTARDESKEWAETLEARVEERTVEIKKMQQRLVHSEKLASVGELVAGIAHEVNNPLTGILVFSTMVQEHPDLAPELKNDMKTIVRETQRCAEIVRGLLEFSRQSPPQMRMEAVNRLLDKTLMLVENQVSFHNIRIVRQYGDLQEILVDPSQIRQVFMNMVINASQAMREGGTLTITTGMDVDHLFIMISDTGSGIRPEHLQKIFDPFFTTKEHEGTGLGLSVSYGIVKSHGGNIEVRSREGEGTTFIVLLPLHPPEDQETEN